MWTFFPGRSRRRIASSPASSQLLFRLVVAMSLSSWFLVCLSRSEHMLLCHALTPTAEIHVFGGGGSGSGATTTTTTSFTLLATQALYGPLSPMRGRRHDIDIDDIGTTATRLVLAPPDNPLLCRDAGGATTKREAAIPFVVVDESVLRETTGAILVVPRGDCTYELKTYVAQSIYKASGVIVYNTLASRYTLNKTDDHDNDNDNGYTVDDIIWPLNRHDYDCSNGKAEIPSSDLNFDQPLPYNEAQNDPLLSGDTSDNLCMLHDDNNLRNCESKRCLVADGDSRKKGANATTTATSSTTTTTVCCAWDLHLLPYPDHDIDANVTISIPTVFITMRQAEQLLTAMKNAAAAAPGTTTTTTTTAVTAIIRSRWRPYYNTSSLLIWALGVAVAAMAAFGSAGDYHTGIRKLLDDDRAAAARQQQQLQSSGGQQQRQPTSSNSHNGLVPRTSSLDEETLELEPIHAVGFVVMASTSLFVLFFFKIYNVVKVMYAIGCSNAVVQVITLPLVTKLLSSRCCRRSGYPLSSPNSYLVRKRLLYRSDDVGEITNWDVVAGILGYTWGMVWLYMALFVTHPDQHVFFWVTQDVMGTCMCITFLSLIQLNSIQVATVLLLVAFVYDIFFVFITPLLFKESVMITVATSGGPPKADALWCEKYPSDPDCAGGDPLPMLLTVPRLLDYAGGASLLGLGDIVLPGLLLSFAARLDAAKCLVGIASRHGGRGGGGRDGSSSCDDYDDSEAVVGCGEEDGLVVVVSSNGGLPPPSSSSSSTSAWHSLLLGHGGYYFVPLVASYAVGLLMANAAVYLMRMGQPALLYLVPCTLGTMTYLGWKRQELHALWVGPKVIAAADEIVYGRRTTTQHQQQQPTTAATTSPGAPAGEGGGGSGTEPAGTAAADEEFVDDETGDVPLLSTTSNNNDKATAAAGSE